MANSNKGNGPAPLDPKIVSKLLDLLSTDDEFRQLFQRDAAVALAKVGYKPSQGAGDMKVGLTAAASSGSCLQMAATDSLASKDQIIEQRAKLEASLNAIHGFTCPAELQSS